MTDTYRRALLLVATALLFPGRLDAQWGGLQPATLRSMPTTGPLNTWGLNTIALNAVRSLALLALFATSTQAQWSGFQAPSKVGTPPPGCAQGSLFVDGCPGAPVGTIQSPALRTAYAAPPPWNVAGVDYYVGIPNGITLQDPATIVRAGVTVDAVAHTVTINGNNITLSGYDFGLANGWYVIVNGANDTIIDSKFKVGSNQADPNEGHALSTTTSASNFSLLNNEVDGNSLGQAVYDGLFSTLDFANTGTLTIQYNYLHRSGGDMIDINDVNLTNFKLRYNYLLDNGYTADHSDTVQFCGSRFTSGDLAFNTVNQTQAGLSGNGLLVLLSECSGSNVQNTTVRNNTLISKVNDDFVTGQFITQDAGTALGDHNATYNNYTDPTGIFNAASTWSPWFGINAPHQPANAAIGTPAALHTLIDMRTANTQFPVTSAAAPSQPDGYISYPDVNGYSPCICDIFTITPSPASGNVNTNGVITFTLLMDAPTTVTGVPTIALNDGGTASYVSGSGTKSLVFSHTVAAGNSATTLAINSISGTMHDDVGNVTLVTPLTNLTTSFAGLTVNQGGSPTLAFTTLAGGAIGSNKAGSGTYTVSAPSGLASATYGGGCAGASTVSGFSASAGAWSATFTTPASACTGTLTVTGTGSNTASATSPSTTFTSGAQTLTLSGVASSAFTSSPVSFTYTETGGVPTAMTCAWSGDGSNLAVSSFVSGASGSGTCPSPASAGTYTMSITGTAGNTATGTAGNSTVVSVSSGSCPKGSAFPDGCPGAPTGSAQFPTLLSGYVTRAPWNVAGVDYYVGVPAGTTLKDPATISNANVSIDSTSHQVDVFGPNVTLDGYDFGLAGGWQVIVEADNVTVTNSNFATGANRNPFVNQVSGSNLTFINDTFNGNSLSDNLAGAAFLLNGGMTLKYSYIHNMGGDDIAQGSNNLVEYNVFKDNGQDPKDHPDWLQILGGTYPSQVFLYNTYYQTAKPSGCGPSDCGSLGLGFSGYGTWSMGTVTVNNNTFVTLSGAGVADMVNVCFSPQFGNNGFITGPINVNNNYGDPTGSNAFLTTDGTLTPPATYTHTGNINMVTGATLP